MMKDEDKPMTDIAPEVNRQWTPPEFTELNTGATAGGGGPNTEANNYAHS